MKIIQIIPYYAPAWAYGGPPRVMFELARELTNRGHQIEVLTTDVYDERRIGIAFNNLEGIRINYLRNVNNYIAWRYKKFIPIGLRNFAKKKITDFELAHYSAVRGFLSSSTYDILLNRNIPYFIDAHGSLPNPTSWKKVVAPIYDKMFMRPFLDNAKGLFAQTEHEMKMYKNYTNNINVNLLPLPIRTQTFAYLPKRGMLRKKYSIDEDDFVLLFLARIEERKGISFLLRGFADFIKNTNVKSKLLIVGRDSGGLNKLRNLIKSLRLERSVILCGPLYDKERLTAYVDSDVFILTPSYYEETSTASLEACMCGVPIIVTKQAEVPYLHEYEAGFIINYNDKNAFIEKLTILQSEKLRRKMGKNGIALIQDEFSVEKVTDKFISLVT